MFFGNTNNNLFPGSDSRKSGEASKDVSYSPTKMESLRAKLKTSPHLKVKELKQIRFSLKTSSNMILKQQIDILSSRKDTTHHPVYSFISKGYDPVWGFDRSCDHTGDRQGDFLGIISWLIMVGTKHCHLNRFGQCHVMTRFDQRNILLKSAGCIIFFIFRISWSIWSRQLSQASN